MGENLQHRNILYDNRQIGAYPTDRLKRVDTPTNKAVLPPEERERRKESDHVMARGAMGALGPELAALAPRMTVQEPLGAAFVDMQGVVANVPQNPVADTKAPIPEDPRVLARHIKSLGIFLGADMVGICKMQPSFAYTHNADGMEVFSDYKYAIVMIARKHVPTVTASDGAESIMDPASFQAYQRLTCQSETMANYIRRLGYEAAPSHMFGYLNMMMPLIIEAGLGEVGRMGLAINPFLGANYKSAAVLTNLPLEVDQPIDFGLQEYCRHCRVCVNSCPANAISEGEKVVYNGYETWNIHREACFSYYLNNRVCGRCSKLCPWSNPDISPEAYADWDGTNEWLHERARQRTKQIIENGWKDPQEETDKWWFDLVKGDMDKDELFVADTELKLSECNSRRATSDNKVREMKQ